MYLVKVRSSYFRQAVRYTWRENARIVSACVHSLQYVLQRDVDKTRIPRGIHFLNHRYNDTCTGYDPNFS